MTVKIRQANVVGISAFSCGAPTHKPSYRKGNITRRIGVCGGLPVCPTFVRLFHIHCIGQTIQSKLGYKDARDILWSGIALATCCRLRIQGDFSAHNMVFTIVSLQVQRLGSSSSPHSAASLQEVAKGFKSSIATADEAYATISHLGCDWNNLVIAYSEGVSGPQHLLAPCPSCRLQSALR